jgi:Zn-dependent protease
LDDLIFTISVWTLPVLIAVTFHEAAHGFIARLRGDDTAWRLGRVTFNPLKHIDPFGTVLLPGDAAIGSLAAALASCSASPSRSRSISRASTTRAST